MDTCIFKFKKCLLEYRVVNKAHNDKTQYEKYFGHPVRCNLFINVTLISLYSKKALFLFKHDFTEKFVLTNVFSLC